jgi:hypothetical protein
MADLASEAAYLVERGVRACALVGTVPARETSALPGELARAGAYSPGAVPFIVERGDGMADYGYAASRWAVDLYRWTFSAGVPLVHRERIHGLLFGYSTEAIERFENRLPALGVVDVLVAVGTGRERVSHVHSHRPMATVRRVAASLGALVTRMRHPSLLPTRKRVRLPPRLAGAGGRRATR